MQEIYNILGDLDCILKKGENFGEYVLIPNEHRDEWWIKLNAHSILSLNEEYHINSFAMQSLIDLMKEFRTLAIMGKEIIIYDL